MASDKYDFEVTVYFPSQFEALRKFYCGNYDSFLHSIFSSKAYKAKGGKSKAEFYKTLDEKYIIKKIKDNELKMFRDMGIGYFEYMGKAFTQYYPTTLAKALGLFKVRYSNKSKSDRKVSCFLLMENILLGVNPKSQTIYDLKGLTRRRYVMKKEEGQVYLDTNFLFDHKSLPIPLHYAMRRIF